MVTNIEPIQPRRARRVPLCKLLCWFVALSVGLVTSYGAFRVARAVYEGPLREVVYRGPLDEEHAGMYALPLVDREQTFDIAATVWVRQPEAAEDEEPDATRGQQGLSDGSSELRTRVPDETPLFSDVVFRGLKLTDKGVRANVSFEIPTERFRSIDATTMDLRGSFTLIPSSPSPLDNLRSLMGIRMSMGKHNLTEPAPWKPRTWPFPMGSAQRERTNIDDAVDTMSITVPLVKFVEIPSRCEAASGKSSSRSEAGVDELSESTIETGAQNQSSINSSKDLTHQQPTTHPGWTLHPYVITRAQVVVIDETRPLKIDELSNRYYQLSLSGNCKPTPENPALFRRQCKKNYYDYGHWENLFYIGKPPETKNEVRYPPYIDVTPGSFGFKDLVPIPVDRENCTLDSSIVLNNRAVNDAKVGKRVPVRNESEKLAITLQLSFAGRSYAKFQTGKSVNSFDDIERKHNMTESELAALQDWSEVKHGVGAHWHRDDLHPRRIFVIEITREIFAFIVALLDFHYWYSLRTTTGVTVFPSALFAGLFLLTQGILPSASELSKGAAAFYAIFTFSTSLLFFVIMARALGRVEFALHSWYPRVYRLPPSHKERRSWRLDERTPWTHKLIAVVLLSALCQGLSLNETYITPHRILETSGTNMPSALDQVVNGGFIIQRVASLVMDISQSNLNKRNKTFAGQYRSAALLRIFRDLMQILTSAPLVVGNREFPSGLSVVDVASSLISAILAWQAVRLSPVVQDKDDDDE